MAGLVGNLGIGTMSAAFRRPHDAGYPLDDQGVRRNGLGARGMKKGDLSRFVEEAVRWRVLEETAEEVRARNEDLPADELEAAIDDAVREVRAAMHAWHLRWLRAGHSRYEHSAFRTHGARQPAATALPVLASRTV